MKAYFLPHTFNLKCFLSEDVINLKLSNIDTHAHLQTRPYSRGLMDWYLCAQYHVKIDSTHFCLLGE